MNEDNRYQLSNGLTVKPGQLLLFKTDDDTLNLLRTVIEYHNPTDEIKEFQSDDNWYLEMPNGHITKGYLNWIVDNETSAIVPSGEVIALMIEFKFNDLKSIMLGSELTLHLKEGIADNSKATWTLLVENSH